MSKISVDVHAFGLGGKDWDDRLVNWAADRFRDAHGADPWLRRVTPEWRTFMAAQLERNRQLYTDALPGLDLLPPASRRCVGTALVLYRRILDRIEERDYDVFSERIRVPDREKVAVGLRSLVDVGGFASPAGTPASVGATVTCQVSLADTLPGLPGSIGVTATVRSALDTYRER